jgi:hypothetical protein
MGIMTTMAATTMKATTMMTTITDPDSTRFKDENNIAVAVGGSPFDRISHAI